ncbi:hypothetical protein DS884_04000 [Tenacibaculum sp. E3R01]|uniref:hypothetical protein n=1 Tax=unclassified Tenacibaculum TaxID=2635139 RepID=UPI00089CE9BC|nr:MULTISPECIES: hypothetical protein [unclassified Tenacibaculum]RBW61001.1 hypothetical protein DS884_04000 [Tenacibaculum sp. E3R01]SEE16833.1 hypothetical protein SAMN04487765_1629 [Tenacibaculum sp. MAR_2010_89]
MSMKLLRNIIRRILKKRTYTTKEQRRNIKKKTIIEIAKKVIEEENKTAKINDKLDKKMSTFLNKNKSHFL